MLAVETIETMDAQELIQAAAELFDPGVDPVYRVTLTSLCRARAERLKIGRIFENTLSEFARLSRESGRTNFPFAAVQLKCGSWTADAGGVYGRDASGRAVTASRIPILPTAILRNIHTGVESVELTYEKRGVHRIVCPRSTISSAQKIVSLSDSGVEVTSETARHLVKYLSDCVTLNLDALPALQSVSSLGWIGEEAFAPYCDVRFDAEREYKHLFEAVSVRGDLSEWIRHTGRLRENLYVRMMLAASFASVLVEPCGCLPFVLHLFGKTGKGKTVALMAAMSVWGDPEMGRLTRTMNMTANSMMSTAAFLNSLPFAGDELQTIKDRWSNYDQLIMRVTEGIDRGRMSYDKLTNTKSWKNAFIFTGEEPCVQPNSGGGAKNRVIQVEVRGDLIADGHQTANFVREHYGAAGRAFIQYVQTLGWAEVRRRYTRLFQEVFGKATTTDKQAMALAMLMLGDALADECLWKTGKPLETEALAGFLFTASDVDASARAYEYMVQTIAVNPFRFETDLEEPRGGEVWGKLEGDGSALVNIKVLRDQLREGGYDFDAVKNDWADQGWIKRDTKKRFTTQTRVQGVRASFVRLSLSAEDNTPDWVKQAEQETKQMSMAET